MVGILAIQGDVEAHARSLEQVGASWVRVRRGQDLEGLDALVLPGGESTTIAKGIDRVGLHEPLLAFARAGHPILGTCAGAVLLGREVENHPVRSLELLDARVVRNAYGTQVDSFSAMADGEMEGLRCVFIRAPQFRDPGPDVEVLAEVEGRPVLVRQANVLAASFHPELTADVRVHQMLIDSIN